jgi:hypothetical protein
MTDLHLGLDLLLGQSGQSLMVMFWYTLLFEIPRYGFPDEFDPFDPAHQQRYVDYCRAAAEYLVDRTEGPAGAGPAGPPAGRSAGPGAPAAQAPSTGR